MGHLHTADQPVPSSGPGGAADWPDWHFRWVDDVVPGQWAQLTGVLRWGGFDLLLAADGVAGLDGRVSAASLAHLPVHLQGLVLQHFAEEALRPLATGPLAELSLLTVQWHATPVPVAGGWGFELRRPGLRGLTRGSLRADNPAARRHLLAAMAASAWPVPPSEQWLAGRLHIGTLGMQAAELAALEPGDLVWLDDALWAPQGLHARFVADAADEPDEPEVPLWLKRADVRLDRRPQAQTDNKQKTRLVATMTDDDNDALLRLQVCSPPLRLLRQALAGALPLQALPQPVRALRWQALAGPVPVLEGALQVVGRRLALQVHTAGGVAPAGAPAGPMALRAG